MGHDVQLVEDLVSRISEFEDLYSMHVHNENGMVLPHVFFWDVVQATIDSYLGVDSESPDWRTTLQFLEEQFERGVPEVDEIIVTSFLNYLPFPGDPGHEIIKYLGPALTERFMKIRPSG